ncbi:hypothetical protein ACWGKK_33490 [Streptomyces chartreusis]
MTVQPLTEGRGETEREQIGGAGFLCRVSRWRAASPASRPRAWVGHAAPRWLARHA